MPSMKGIIIIAFVIRGMEVLKLFDEIYLLTRGGPGTATETLSLYLYKLAFEDFRLAYAGAAGFIVLVITVVLINVMLRPTSHGEHPIVASVAAAAFPDSDGSIHSGRGGALFAALRIVLRRILFDNPAVSG